METIGLSIEDVLDLAIKMESNGALFYDAASEIGEEADMKKMFSGLAAMERVHMEKLVQLKEKIVIPDATNSPAIDSAVSAYLLSWVDGEVFDKDFEATLKTIKNGNLSDAVRTAIQFENDSIAFYTGLREYVVDKETENIISKIIKEEFRHVAKLYAALKGLI